MSATKYLPPHKPRKYTDTVRASSIYEENIKTETKARQHYTIYCDASRRKKCKGSKFLLTLREMVTQCDLVAISALININRKQSCFLQFPVYIYI